MTERRAQDILARSFRWFDNRIFTNVWFAGGEMDLAVVTKAGMLWEIEIKTTKSDWAADSKKRKWGHPDRHKISRFYYAVPRTLVMWPPWQMPDYAGIIAIGQSSAWVHRKARVRRGYKVTQQELDNFMRSTYYRYWRERLRVRD